MSEITMLTVKTDFDDSGLRKLEAKVASALETARRLVEQFNKNAELSISTGAFVKGLQKIDQELKRLRKECDHIEISPDMSTFEETLDWLERRLNSLEKDYLLTIRVNTEELQKAEALVSGLGQKQAGEARQAGIDPHVEIKKLEEEHETAKKLNEQLYASKEEQEANFVETRKKYLEKVQGVLEDAALKEIESDKRAKDETIANIQAVKAELESLSETGIGMKEVVGSIQAINGPLINFTTQLNALHAAETSAKLKSLEKSKERELKLIDESLAAEMAMYEGQLAQYAGLEKESLTKDHNERMEELNSRMQEHLTEEEWRTIQEQMDAETLSYEESMAALQADTEARDALRAEKELAEQQAAERKAELGFSTMPSLLAA